MEGDQPVHAQKPLQPLTCVQEHCPGETGIPLSLLTVLPLATGLPS